MNETLRSASIPVATHLEPPVRLLRLVLGLLVSVTVFDICFCGAKSMGASVALFVLLLAGVILSNRETLKEKRTLALLLSLLAGAAFAAVLEFSPQAWRNRGMLKGAAQ